jgi:hypothetical protein
MGDGSGMLPVADDDHDLGDGHDSVAIELARTGGGSMGPRRGSGGTAHGGGARGNNGVLGDGHFGRDRGDDSGTYGPKINFPSFDGESDPLPWLKKCATYFRGMGTQADERVWMASLHLDGIAAEWYYALECDVRILTWPRFSELVNMRFAPPPPPPRHNGLAKLKELRRTGTMEEYQRQFLMFMCCCDDMTPMS